MGLLDNVLGGNRRGGPSTITMALLALLAYRTYHGKGRLAEMLGRTAPEGGRQLDNGRADGRSSQGGLGGLLGDLLGRSGSGGSGNLSDLLRGGLGGLLSGAGAGTAGGFLGSGLEELLRKIQQGGQAGAADSWVGKGTNRQIDPDQLELALGRDTLEELSQQTGKPYRQVLEELSNDLPNTVDKLTPDGRLPTQEERERWL